MRLSDVRKILSFDIVETGIGTHIEVLGYPHHEIYLNLILQPFVGARLTVGRTVVSDTPEGTRKREEVGIEIETVFTPREQGISPHAEQIETGCRHVAEKRNVRRGNAQIVFIYPIESRRDDSQTQLYGARIVRSADYTEVEILFLCFILVCGSEVGVEFAKKVVLFDYGIAVFPHSGHIVMLNDGISIIFKDRIVREAQNGVSDVLPRSATCTSGRTATAEQRRAYYQTK